MQSGQLSIHTENILPIIKQWLYSDKDIFLRELVANATDAISKLRRLQDHGVSLPEHSPRIEVEVDLETQTIKISDNGLGMSREEVEKYICQVAFSSAEEFLNHYTSNREEDQIIGHFGLGFYSAYMIAHKVTIETRSYRAEEEPVRWECDGSTAYTMEMGSRESVGTTITLHVSEENGEYLEEGKILEILHHHCSFLPYPIFLGEKQINELPPLWLKNPKECTDEEYLTFYRHLYPAAEDPIFWVHLNVDYPFHLRGILYFPKQKGHRDWKRASIKLFCNRVFVSDHCEDVVPEYLTVLRGAIDSPDIPLNVSRSYLQRDRNVRQLGKHIAKKVTDALQQLMKSDRERYIASWEDLSTVLKLGAVEDDKFFERVKELLIWKTAQNEWTDVEAYLDKNGDRTQNKVLYTSHEDQIPHLLRLYKEKGIDILYADHPVDPYLITHIEKNLSVQFQRIDSVVDDSLIDSSKENDILDAEGKTESGRLGEFFQRNLGGEKLKIDVKSLSSDGILGLVTTEEGSRRLRDFMRATQPDGDSHKLFEQERTLVLNSNSPLVRGVAELESSDPDLASELSQEIYELVLLSQKELGIDHFDQFVQRSQKVLTSLVTAKAGK